VPTYPLYSYQSKNQAQIRADILRTIKNGLIGQGIAQPNVGPNSDYYLTATAVANEIAVGQANDVVMADQHMPDAAGGSNLDRWLAQLGLARNPAIGSTGLVTFTASIRTGILIVAGTQATDANGLRYMVTTTGTYTPGTQLPFNSIDTGAATNHANGDTLTWVTPPPFCASTVTVGTPGGSNGLGGGLDSEVGVDEPPRQRLLQRMSTPPAGGNWADVVNWALQSAPGIVQGCAVYPALLGAGTVFFAVFQAPQLTAPLGSTSKNRAITSAVMTGQVIPYVQGSYPEHALVVGTPVANQPVDLAFILSLPAAPTASPPGLGGGWLDGSPWPTTTGPGTGPATVGTVTSSTVFQVNTIAAPTAGVSHIAWLNPANWTLYTATVLSYTGASSPYTVTIDTPMPGIATGMYVFPQSVNQQNYVNAYFQAFSLMGPGEWTSNAGALARGFRHPLPASQWDYFLDATFLRQLEDAGPEVLSASWVSRYDHASSLALNAPYAPYVPTFPPTVSGTTLTSAAPGVFTPSYVGFYQA
jgi:uncharacterized phage protein gp47/JayE